MAEIQTGHGPLIQPLPFSLPEYQRRHMALLSAMESCGLDAFISFGPENINYLTGHDTPAYQYLQACLVTRHAPPINVLRAIEVGNTLQRTWSRQAVAYDDNEEPIDVLAGLVAEVCGEGCRIGIEAESFFVTPRRFNLLHDRLGDAIKKVVEAQLVEPLRLIKSEEELAHLRRAATITERAMRAAIAVACEGVTENDIAAEVWGALVRGGGEFPGLPPFIVAGPRSSLGHATWAGRRLEHGDPIAFEIPGVVHRYAAPLFRCGSVGPPARELQRLANSCSQALEALIDAIRPGVVPQDLHRISAAIFARHGLRAGHRSGYSVGVGYAPDWGEGHILSIMEGERRPLQAGMVFHLVPGIFVPGRHAIVISETVAVTEGGCECLTNFPRQLFVV